jgi:hypothetical protein
MNEWMHDVLCSPFVSVARIRVQEDDYEETRKIKTKGAAIRNHDEKMKAKAKAPASRINLVIAAAEKITIAIESTVRAVELFQVVFT